MLQLKKCLRSTGILISFLFLTTSCNNKETDYATPTVSVNGEHIIDLAPGETTIIKLALKADGGAKSVVVNKNGGFLKEYPVHATASEFIYTTEALANDLEEGEEVKYSFILVNLNNVDSAEIPVTIKSALYNKITVGNTQLFSVNIGTDGIVPAGQHIKLIKERNYFIPNSLTFESGASLTIEEGVQVYMNADAPTPITLEIAGEANITGTTTNPVVITSSKVLTDPTTAAAGNWNRFTLTGAGASSNNGKISHLRLEYGGDRVFRLMNVGATTQISHIQVFHSTGEGFMITDGNAQLKYLVATDCQGGSYRLGEKYVGKIQFAISVNSSRFGENDDFTIREDAAPTIANITLLGAGEEVANTHGMRMRANAAPKVYNSIIAQFPRRGLRADDNVAITDLAGSTVFAYSYVFNVKTDPYRGSATAFAGTFNTTDGAIETNPFHNNAISLLDKKYTFKTIDGIGVADFIPTAQQTSEFNPSSLGTFFVSAPYVGAIRDASDDWTKGWVKNPDGSVR